MDVFDDLISASKDKENLAAFLEKNTQEIYDFLLIQSFKDLAPSKNKVENYILKNLKLIRQLDFSNQNVITFTTLLLDVSERFGFLLAFQRLYKLLTTNNCQIGCRLNAASLYLLGIKSISDYNDRILAILNKLSEASKNEEDNDDRIIGCIVKYYAQVVYNFGNHNKEGVQEFRTNLISYSTKFYFLQKKIIQSILKLDFTDNISAFNKIQDQLDIFLNKTRSYGSFINNKLLIEENTQYSKLLSNVDPNFKSIRQISVKEWKKINESSFFHSLQRGVKVLTEEKQLFLYLNSYGPMHDQKMKTSFSFLANDIMNSEAEIIDWGCGQGIATISLLEYFKNKIDLFRKVILIEPSEIAIKRASLHTRKLKSDINILTVNKDLDSLKTTDFVQTSSNKKIHLFSNILDIDLFSLTQLVNLIKSTFKGDNYFICVSPYINILKTSRLDSFVQSFSENNDFQIIKEINNKKHEWKGTDWTRVVRIFKANL